VAAKSINTSNSATGKGGTAGGIDAAHAGIGEASSWLRLEGGCGTSRWAGEGLSAFCRDVQVLSTQQHGSSYNLVPMTKSFVASCLLLLTRHSTFLTESRAQPHMVSRQLNLSRFLCIALHIWLRSPVARSLVKT
jgi:hypothetical protein